MSERDDIRVRLAELENEGGGRLTPSAVVDEARDPESPLHSRFEWDDSKAAHAHRLSQARDLIVSIRVVQTTKTNNIRAVYYVRDPSAGFHEQGYVSTATVKSSEDMAREVLVSEFTAVADRLRRAREVAAVLDARDEVESLLEQVVGLRQRFQPPAMTQ